MPRKTLYILATLVIFLLIGCAYIVFHETVVAPTSVDVVVSPPVVGDSAPTLGKRAPYVWNFTMTTSDDIGTPPYTSVSIKVGETTHLLGAYQGSCCKVPAGEPGVLSELADPLEVSRVQCWFAGGGDEIGVFEDGPNISIRSAELNEGIEGGTAFRGNWKTLLEL